MHIGRSTAAIAMAVAAIDMQVGAGPFGNVGPRVVWIDEARQLVWRFLWSARRRSGRGFRRIDSRGRTTVIDQPDMTKCANLIIEHIAEAAPQIELGHVEPQRRVGPRIVTAQAF